MLILPYFASVQNGANPFTFLDNVEPLLSNVCLGRTTTNSNDSIQAASSKTWSGGLSVFHHFPIRWCFVVDKCRRSSNLGSTRGSLGSFYPAVVRRRLVLSGLNRGFFCKERRPQRNFKQVFHAGLHPRALPTTTFQPPPPALLSTSVPLPNPSSLPATVSAWAKLLRLHFLRNS